MAAMKLVGRTSHSVLGDPRALFAPATRIGRARARSARGSRTLVELPVSVSPGLRLPAIGTSLLAGADDGARAAARVDAQAAVLQPRAARHRSRSAPTRTASPAVLVAQQPDLRATLQHKQRALEATLDRLAPDYRFATLRDVAAEVQREGVLH